MSAVGPDPTVDVSIRCPACGAVATLTRPCPECGRRDARADRLLAIDASVTMLGSEVHRTRAVFDLALASWRAEWQVRQALITEMLTSQAVSTAGPASESPDVAPPDLAPPDLAVADARGALGRPDASPRTVQNLLFVLGGVLLGIGAIVFTAVAWATYGVPGRAAVLGVATVIALIAPVIAARRGLAATAETVAAVGLLLVVLDGYGLWTLNVFHVGRHMAASTYAGVVAAIVAVVAWVYGRLVRLVGTRFVALIAIQPVLPLLTATHVTTVVTIAWCYAGVAALDLALVMARQRAIPGRSAWPVGRRTGAGGSAWTAGRRAVPGRDAESWTPDPIAVALTVLAWIFAGIALATATVAASIAISISNEEVAVARGAGAVAVVAVTLLGAGYLTRRGVVRAFVVGVATLEVGIALLRMGIVATPIYPLAVASLVVLGTVAAARLVRTGTWAAAGVVGAARIATGALSLVVVGSLGDVIVRRAAPVSERAWWHTVLGALTSPAGPAGHPIATTATILAAIAIVPAPHHRWIGAPGAALVALSMGTVAGVPWWGMLVADGVAVMIMLATAAVLLHRRVDSMAAVALGSAAVLLLHAIWFGLARPAATAAVFGAAIACAVGFVAATRTAGAVRHYADRRVVEIGRSAAIAVGFGTSPAFAAGLAGAAGATANVDIRAAASAVGVSLAALVMTRSRPHIRWYAVGAVTLVAAIVALTAPQITSADAASVYVMAAVLVIALAALAGGLRDRRGLIAMSPAVLLSPYAIGALIGVLAATYVVPYRWLAHIWTGAPSGVGVAPTATHLDRFDLTTALLAAAAAVVAGLVAGGRILAQRVAWHAIAPVAVAILVVAAAPWPTVPAIVLMVGAAEVLRAAFEATRRGWEVGVTGVVLIGAGTAALTPTKVSTLGALGAAFVVSVIVAIGAGTTVRRVAGWFAAIAVADTFAIASTLAGGARIGASVYGILAVAAVAMFATASPAFRADPVALQASDGSTMTAVIPRRWRAHSYEAAALMAGAQASAAIAFGLSGTVTRAAIIAATWGVLIAIRALPVDVSREARMWWVCAGAGLEMLAWWLLASAHHVRTVEAYTLPFAAVALLAGWLAARSRPLNSWLAYGTALLAALLPSLAPALSLNASPERRLIVGVGALAVVLVGAYFRLQAPVVTGGATVLGLALHEIVLISRLLPTWAPLTAAGVIVLACAITYERRRRDLTRLRDTIGRMA